MRDGSQTAAELYEVIRHSIGTAVVAEVVSFDVARSTVSLRPLVLDDRVDSEGEREQLGAIVIDDVPVMLPSTPRRGLTFGLSAGDRGLAVFRHQSHDEVDAGRAAPLLPASTRRMDYGDLVFFPGYYTPAADRPSSQRASNGEPVLYMDAGDVLRIATAAASIALARADLVEQEMQAVQGELADISVALTTHVHTGVTTGPGTSGTAAPVWTPTWAPSSVATSRVVVDD